MRRGSRGRPTTGSSPAANPAQAPPAAGASSSEGEGTGSPVEAEEAIHSAELEPLIREAMTHRSDLKQRESALEAARKQVSLARGDHYPTIGLDATYILDRRNFSEFAEKTDWTAQVFLSFPVFDGGRARANVATASSQLRQAGLDRDELARQIRLDVQDARLTFQSDLAQVRTQQARVASADENFRLAQEEYRSGLATNLEVIT